MIKKIALIALAAFAFSSFSTASYALDMKAWGKQVMKQVAKKQKYPRSALNNEIEGRAKIKLTVSADGTITDSKITQATGAKVLDREIPKLIAKLSPLPALPAGKTEFTFTIPLTWALN